MSGPLGVARRDGKIARSPDEEISNPFGGLRIVSLENRKIVRLKFRPSFLPSFRPFFLPNADATVTLSRSSLPVEIFALYLRYELPSRGRFSAF